MNLRANTKSLARTYVRLYGSQNPSWGGRQMFLAHVRKEDNLF